MLYLPSISLEAAMTQTPLCISIVIYHSVVRDFTLLSTINTDPAATLIPSRPQATASGSRVPSLQPANPVKQAHTWQQPAKPTKQAPGTPGLWLPPGNTNNRRPPPADTVSNALVLARRPAVSRSAANPSLPPPSGTVSNAPVPGSRPESRLAGSRPESRLAGSRS
jgi:hypothetical protein